MHLWTKGTGAKALLVMDWCPEGMVGADPEEEDEDIIVWDTEANSEVLYTVVQTAVSILARSLTKKLEMC